MTIDFQGLLNVLKAAEQEPNLIMSEWIGYGYQCGTTHCMIGAFCDQNQEDELIISRKTEVPILRDNLAFTREEAIARRFGITEYEACWLFILNPLPNPHCRSASNLPKSEALGRLRKFIYYKLHKQDMIAEVGRNKQLVHIGRNISGRSSALLATKA